MLINHINIISAGAPKLGMTKCAKFFSQNTGISVHVDFATAPIITNTISLGECSADIVLAPASTIRKLEKTGHVIKNSGMNFGSVKIAVVVKTGTEEPNLLSKETLKRAILNSKRVIFNEASSGQYISLMIKKMGITKETYDNIMITKTGADVINYLDGSLYYNEIGFSQVTEIQLKIDEGKNIKLVGTLPKEIEHVSTYRSALLKNSADNQPAKDMIYSMASAEGRRICKAAGLT